MFLRERLRFLKQFQVTPRPDLFRKVMKLGREWVNPSISSVIVAQITLAGLEVDEVYLLPLRFLVWWR